MDGSSPTPADATPVDIHGEHDPRFDAVRDAFAANFAEQGDVGASVAITVDGEMVVDLWGGTATYDDGERPWEHDTIINVWSTTKTMAALSCLMLADRGELDLYAPIATYWPEFAAAGKETVATRHVLGHTAGLSGWDEPLVADGLCEQVNKYRVHTDDDECRRPAPEAFDIDQPEQEGQRQQAPAAGSQGERRSGDALDDGGDARPVESVSNCEGRDGRQ